MNECHSRACGIHMLGFGTAQKILCAWYFWLLMSKYCIAMVQKWHNFQVYDHKIHAPPTLLHPIIVSIPFEEWGINSLHVIVTQLGGMGILS